MAPTTPSRGAARRRGAAAAPGGRRRAGQGAPGARRGEPVQLGLGAPHARVKLASYEHFLAIGKNRCGKTTLLRGAAERLPSVAVLNTRGANHTDWAGFAPASDDPTIVCYEQIGRA